MKKRRSFYIKRTNVFTLLSILSIVAAFVLTIVVACRREVGDLLFARVVLPCISYVIFLCIILIHQKEHIYRTAVPVAFMCFAEILYAFSFNSKWKAIAIILLSCIYAVCFYRAISGKIKNRFAIALLVMYEILLLVLYGYTERAVLAAFPAELKLIDLAFVCANIGAILFTISLKEYHDNAYHKTWGDRPDGRMVRSLDPMTYVGVYIMPNRNGANNYFRETLDVTDIDKYIHKRRRIDMPHLTITQIYLAAYCRTIAKFPALNRFISGQHIYTREGDIIFNMMVKREMSVDGEETSVTLHLTPNDTLQEVSDKLDAAIKIAKAPEEGDFDKVAALINVIPGLMLKFTVWMLKVFDYFGLLPSFLLEVSPFHGSIFFTSMASLGIPAIYHHLYDFGNMPVFCCLGTKYKRNIIKADGSVEERKLMDFTIDCDERICDGFYYATAFKTFKRYILHPELLEVPPENIVKDVD